MASYDLKATKITQRLSFDLLSSALNRTLLHRNVTIAELVRATDIPKDRLRAYRLGTQAPSFWAFLRVAKALGPDFLNSVLAPLGMGGVHWLHTGDICVLRLNGTVSKLAERIAASLEDGVICHREIADLVPVARRLHIALGAFLRKYDNGEPAAPERVGVAA